MTSVAKPLRINPQILPRLKHLCLQISTAFLNSNSQRFPRTIKRMIASDHSPLYDAENNLFEEENGLKPQSVPLGSSSITLTVFLHQEYNSDIHPDDLGEFTCDDSSTISDWWMVNDGNTDCADGSDEGFDYANWPSEIISASFNRAEIGYWFEVKLMAENYVVSDAFSNSKRQILHQNSSTIFTRKRSSQIWRSHQKCSSRRLAFSWKINTCTIVRYQQ